MILILKNHPLPSASALTVSGALQGRRSPRQHPRQQARRARRPPLRTDNRNLIPFADTRTRFRQLDKDDIAELLLCEIVCRLYRPHRRYNPFMVFGVFDFALDFSPYLTSIIILLDEWQFADFSLETLASPPPPLACPSLQIVSRHIPSRPAIRRSAQIHRW